MAVACCVLFSEKYAENLESKGNINTDDLKKIITATIRKAQTLAMITCKNNVILLQEKINQKTKGLKKLEL